MIDQNTQGHFEQIHSVVAKLTGGFVIGCAFVQVHTTIQLLILRSSLFLYACVAKPIRTLSHAPSNPYFLEEFSPITSEAFYFFLPL